jgi:agmatine/peptidylarginine deiminase
MPQYKIISVNGHYVVYVEGKFFCIAKTVTEAIKKIEKEFG